MAKQTMGYSCQALSARADQKLYHLQVSASIFIPAMQLVLNSSTCFNTIWRNVSGCHSHIFRITGLLYLTRTLHTEKYLYTNVF